MGASSRAGAAAAATVRVAMADEAAEEANRLEERTGTAPLAAT